MLTGTRTEFPLMVIRLMMCTPPFVRGRSFSGRRKFRKSFSRRRHFWSGRCSHDGKPAFQEIPFGVFQQVLCRVGNMDPPYGR